VRHRVRQKRRKELGGEEGALAHRGRRIRAKAPAVAAKSGVQFEQPRGIARAEKERGEGGGAGLYTGADTLRRVLGFSTGARRWTAEGDPVQEEESLPEVGDDMWDRASERERRAGLIPVRLGRLAGPGPKWSLGRMVSPGLFSIYFSIY
jgi:hypothetical protein